MKRLIIAILLGFLFLSTSKGFCDEVDESLKNMASQEVRNSTRMMIENGVPNDEAVNMTRLMLEKQFKQENILKAHEIVLGAKNEGLPVEPIINKVYEGTAKQVQEKKVIQAMETVQSRYRFAAKQAEKMTKEQGQRDRIRNMIADCNAARIADEDIERVTYEFQQRARQMNSVDSDNLAEECFKTLRLMARRGISSEDSADIICEALRNRYTARNMNTLRNRFMAQLEDSDPNHLAKQIKTQMQNGIGSGDLNGGTEHGSGHGGSEGSTGSGDSGSSSGSGSSGNSGGQGSGGSGGSSGHGGNGGSGGK